MNCKFCSEFANSPYNDNLKLKLDTVYLFIRGVDRPIIFSPTRINEFVSVDVFFCRYRNISISDLTSSHTEKKSIKTGIKMLTIERYVLRLYPQNHFDRRQIFMIIFLVGWYGCLCSYFYCDVCLAPLLPEAFAAYYCNIFASLKRVEKLQVLL